MRIGHRIIVSLSLMAVVVGCISAFTLYATSRMDSVIKSLVSEEIPNINNVDDVVTTTTIVSIKEQRFLTFGDPDNLRELKAGLNRLERLADKLGKDRGGNEAVYLDLSRKLRRFIQLEREVIALYEEGDVELARHRTSGAGNTLRQEIIHDCSNLLDDYRRNLFQHESEYASMGDELKKAALFFAGLSVLLAGLLAFQGIRAIIGPLDRLVETTAVIRAGDLSRRAEVTSEDELSQLAESFNKMVHDLQATLEAKDRAQVELTESNLLLLQREEQFRRELRFAQKVQRSIVPRLPEMRGVRIFSRIQAAREVGGDFYDVFELRPGDGKVGCVVGDVMGKGVPAALLMVMAITVMRESYREATCVSDLFRLANDHMQEQIREEDLPRGVSAAGVLIDTHNRELSYAKAGHEDILLWRANEARVEALSAPGIFLGIFTDETYEERHTHLEIGDKLFLYTDGITEARDAEGELFGNERLVALVEREGRQTVDDLGRLILEAVERHQAGTEPSDDIALVIIEIAED